MKPAIKRSALQLRIVGMYRDEDEGRVVEKREDSDAEAPSIYTGDKDGSQR